MEEFFTTTSMLLNKINNELLELNEPSHGISPVWRWKNGYLTNEYYLEKLLPLCKLLNQVFFECENVNNLKAKPAE